MQLQKFFALLILFLYSPISLAQATGQKSIWTFPSQLSQNAGPYSLELSHNASAINFHLNKIELDNSASFDSLTISGLAKTVEEQMPERPFVALIVEGEINDEQIEIETGESYSRQLNVRAGAGTKCRCANDKVVSLDRGPLVFPQELFKLQRLGVYQGKILTRITIYPMQVSASTVTVFPQLKVKINNAFIFSQELDLNAKNKLLMIGNSGMRAGLQDLIQLRQSQGYQVEFLAVDTSLPHDNIRSVLKNEIDARKDELAAVLFVGHEMLLPTFYRTTKFSTQTPTDLPYITFDGDQDWMPDVLSGRISVMSLSELQIVIAKIINYETKNDGSRQRKIMGIASNEGSNPTDVEYLQSMLQPLISASNVDKFVFKQGDANATAENIQRRWSNGLDWVNYIGHGSGQSWPSVSGSEFNTGHIARIASSDRNPIVIDVACQNGRFNNQQRFGESLMLKNNAGAAAYYGGSVDISWDPPAIMAIGINQSLRPGDESILGTNLMQGQLHLIQNHSSVEDLRDNMTWYHLQGDPLTRVQF